MKRFKGTKGNWTSNFSAVNSGNIQIADVYCRKECSVAEFTKDDWKEAYANAQLIATAPELLEASIMVAEMLNFNKGEEIPEDAWNANANNLLCIINKALGL